MGLNDITELAAPPATAGANDWLSYWVKVRASCKSWDFALSRHAMREVRRLSRLVGPKDAS